MKLFYTHKKKILILLIFSVYLLYSYPDDICDGSLLPESGPLGYRQRNELCEGLYKPPVSRSTITIAGLLIGELNYQLNKEEILEVSSYLKNRKIKVRASCIPLDTYYRMDAGLDQNEIIEWPVENVILQKNLVPEKIGVLGWILNEDDNKDMQEYERKYVPVIVKSKNQPAASSTTIINIIFRSTINLSFVQWRYKIPDEEGWKEWNILEKRIYLKGIPITITLPPDAPAILELEIAGKDKKDDWNKSPVYTIVLK